MKTITLILLLFSFNIAFSQSNPYEVKFSYQIENEVAEGSLRTSKAGLLHSFIGNYHLANTYSDIPLSWGVDSLELHSFDLTNALPIIVQEAQNHQVVIISENHLKPQHRIFAKKVILELSKFGFNHLGLETFSHVGNNELLDSNLVIRGYPLNSPMTGTYTMEPQMGQLVREAIQSDYKLFAYERTQKIKGKDRDEIQADNIINYIESHPDEKVIIFCGFHHAIESDIPKRVKHRWMANYIKDKIGIDPLTIYQDNFSEKFIEDEHPYLSQTIISEPSLFIDKDGKVISLTPHVDIEIIHPKTVYKDGRPDWLYESADFKSVKITKEIKELDYPMIVTAYKINEVNSVPVDRIELKHKYDNKKLVLPLGDYSINLFDGKNHFDYQYTVK